MKREVEKESQVCDSLPLDELDSGGNDEWLGVVAVVRQASRAVPPVPVDSRSD